MEGGQDRARPTGRPPGAPRDRTAGAPESVDDLLARHGHPAPVGGRAARRRAAEEQAARESPGSNGRPAGGWRRAPEPAPTELTTALPLRTTPSSAAPAGPATRHSPPPERAPRPDPPAAGRGAAGPPTRHPAQPGPATAGTTSRPAGSAPSHPNAAPRRSGPTRTGATAGTAPSPPGRAPAGPPRRPAGAPRNPTGRAPGSHAVGPARDDVGSGVPDVSEQAERTRRTEREGAADTRSQRIDETLTRLTAAHAGLALPARDGAEPEEDDEPPPRPRRARPSAAKLLVLALAVAVVASTTVGWAAQSWLGSAVRDAAALDEGSGAIVDAAAQKGDTNVLVVATDRGSAPGTAAQPATPRPDTVVVAHIPAGGPMTVLSVPADLEINRPPCERFDPAAAAYTPEIVPAQARTQLATALDAGGPRCATRVIQQLTGLAVTGYVGMDLDRMAAVVDAVSGVRVCVARPVQDRVLGPVVPDPGTTTLDGSRAGDFVRASDVDDDPPAGLGRVERQQQVLAGVLDTTLTSTGLLNLPRIAALRPALGAALTTDRAGLGEVLALARSLRAFGSAGVTSASVPVTSGTNGRGNAVLRDADAAALFAALRTHAPLPPAAAGSSDAGPAPRDVTVQVLNASGTTGTAARIGETLKSLGFGIGPVSNAPQPTAQTVIRYSPDQAAAADLLAGTVPAATTVPDPGATGLLQLVLGRSFDGIVRAPTQPVTTRSSAGDTAPASTPSCA